MRWFSAAVIFLLASTASSAQILAVHLKDSKVAEKYTKYLIFAKGKYLLAGEAVPGTDLKIDLNANNVTYTQNQDPIQIFIADPADPSKTPYKLVAGVKTLAPGGTILKVAKTDFERIDFLMRDQTLIGLGEEYKLRLQLVNEAKAERDRSDKASKAWAEGHRNVINSYERLQSWLSGTLYERAAKNLEKTVLNEAKMMKDDAVRVRTTSAKASVKKMEIPPELIEANQALTNGSLKFSAVESKHVRIIATAEAGGVEKLLGIAKLAETIIEGFRRDFIDPNLGDDFGDPIPDEVFHEFWLGPSDVKLYEGFLEQFYHRSIGSDRREERLAMSGTRARGARGAGYLDYFKVDGSGDPEAIVAHGLGHSLANIVFNRDRSAMPIDWIEEGCAYFISFEYLGRNTVTCKDFAKREYGISDVKEGDKTVGMGQRGEFNKLALAKGVTIGEMSLKRLANFDDADLAKSWSVFDYIAHKEGKNGLKWLMAACDAAKEKQGFLERWRAASKEILKVEAGDPLDAIEARWKEFAQSGQKKDSSTKKVK